MPLNRLQDLLEQLYDVEVTSRVEDFLIEDRQIALTLAAAEKLGETPEALLVQESGNELAVSLYLDAAVMDRLRHKDPLNAIDSANFAPLMLAVEGVSHFLCLVWHAIAERPVSQLALELQAEVDKFIVGRALITRQHGLRAAAPLHHWLFARSRLRPLLSEESRRRYVVAGRLAADYCQRLHRAAALAPLPPAAELRRFFRLSPPEKLRRAAGTLPLA